MILVLDTRYVWGQQNKQYISFDESYDFIVNEIKFFHDWNDRFMEVIILSDGSSRAAMQKRYVREKVGEREERELAWIIREILDNSCYIAGNEERLYDKMYLIKVKRNLNMMYFEENGVDLIFSKIRDPESKKIQD